MDASVGADLSEYLLSGGFYLAGMLAPNRPMRHAIILGIIGTVFATLGAAANWDNQPIGIHFACARHTPCAWLGGRLAESRKSKQPMA